MLKTSWIKFSRLEILLKRTPNLETLKVMKDAPQFYYMYQVLQFIVYFFHPDPERSPSPVSSSSDNEDIDNDVEDESELLENMAEKEAELNRTQQLIDERNKQVEATIMELRLINDLLRQIETLTHNDTESKR
ncbi:unnamed protein product [Adineta steineri]|uniref:Uncharacterized protein n=1 Tax=Adineta steineri TaxID=433720 RepID=A0A819TZ40_9BILA|nr:unnamed protein product [Adineta steineri]